MQSGLNNPLTRIKAAGEVADGIVTLNADDCRITVFVNIVPAAFTLVNSKIKEDSVIQVTPNKLLNPKIITNINNVGNDGSMEILIDGDNDTMGGGAVYSGNCEINVSIF